MGGLRCGSGFGLSRGIFGGSSCSLGLIGDREAERMPMLLLLVVVMLLLIVSYVNCVRGSEVAKVRKCDFTRGRIKLWDHFSISV